MVSPSYLYQRDYTTNDNQIETILIFSFSSNLEIVLAVEIGERQIEESKSSSSVLSSDNSQISNFVKSYLAP